MIDYVTRFPSPVDERRCQRLLASGRRCKNWSTSPMGTYCATHDGSKVKLTKEPLRRGRGRIPRDSRSDERRTTP